MARVTRFDTILDAKAATWVWITIPVTDFKHIAVQVWTASSANLTCKCQWAIWTTAPTFSSAATVANHWDYVYMYNYQTGTWLAGDTWFVVAWTDAFENYLINTDWLDFITFIVTARSAWNVTVKTRCYENC